MTRESQGRRLVAGTLILAAIAASAIAVLVFARVGALHGATFRLYAATGSARGVIRGTEVWLAGEKVGQVVAIDFRPASADTSRRLLLSLDVYERVRPLVRRSSSAAIRPGTSLIGTPVVAISVGAPPSPELHEGDTLRSTIQADPEGLASRFALATREVPALLTSVRALGATFDSTGGAAGAALAGDVGRQLATASARARAVTARLSAGRGTVGLAVRDVTLRRRAAHVLAIGDSLRTLLASNRGTIGRFRRDSTVFRHLAAAQQEAARVRTLLAEARGTAGRAVADRALVLELARLSTELGALMADIKQHPLRYLF